MINKYWIEVNVKLTDDSKFNQVLNDLVKPLVNELYKTGQLKSWHYFREPNLRWRLYIEDGYVFSRESNWHCDIKQELEEKLTKIENQQPDIYKSHFYGEHGIQGKEYIGEQALYGNDAWELCYKRWEAGSNLALLLCTSNPNKSIPFHYTRDIHLFENQLGIDYADAILLYLKWVKILMGCDPEKRFDKYIDVINATVNDTYKYAKMNGI